MGSFTNPFNSPFGANKPEQLPLSSLAGKPMVGPGRSGRSKGAGGSPPPAGSSVVWTEGFNAAGHATIASPLVTFDGSAAQGVYDNVMTPISPADATGLWYAEFEIVSYTPSIDLAFHVRDKARILNNANTLEGIGIAWYASASQWYYTRSATSALGAASGNATAPQAGDIVGFAYDNVANKIYGHINGSWLNGNAPSSGAGQGTTTGAASCALDVVGKSSSVRAVIPQYLPSGYTSLT